eukprot:m.542924 g.542924  ORF g.542924 m.542924 type:complete len:53 (+) comp339760_c0_seq1:101-259(+)
MASRIKANRQNGIRDVLGSGFSLGNQCSDGPAYSKRFCCCLIGEIVPDHILA